MSAVHPSAIIEDGAKIGADVKIGPFCVVGSDVTLGDGVVLHAHVILQGHTVLGTNCEVSPGAVLGGAPQIIGMSAGKSRLEIGEGCVFREHTTVHGGSPAAGGLTKVGANGYFMVGSHIAHDAIVGEKCVFANSAAVGGHVVLGEQVWLGGLSVIHQFCRMGDHSFLAGGGVLVDDVIPFASAIGYHAELAGLNIRGLKRRGFTRSDISEMRAVYATVFSDDGTFAERRQKAEERHGGGPMARQVLDFLNADNKRPICQPRSKS